MLIPNSTPLIMSSPPVPGFKVYEYLVYSRHRFQMRKARWKGMEDSMDDSIDENLRTMDQLCFSSQFYFVVTLLYWGIILLVFGIQACILNRSVGSYCFFALIPIDPLSAQLYSIH